MQELTLDIMAYALAEWQYETEREIALEMGIASEEEVFVAWDAIPDEHPNKQLMIAVCKKLLQTDFIKYTVSSEE